MSHHAAHSPTTTVEHLKQQKGHQQSGERRRQWWWRWDSTLLLNIGGTFFCLFSVFWATGISIVLFFTLLLSTILGFLFASLLVNNAHLCVCAQIVLAQLVGLLPADDAMSKGQSSTTITERPNSEQSERKGPQQHFGNRLRSGHANSNYIAPPWERIKIDARLNRELEELFETLLESYVNSWYTGLISNDTAFLLEVRHLIRHSSAKLINSLISVDLRSLFTNDLFPLVLAHVERICRLTNTTTIGHERHPADIAQMPALLAEFNVLDHWTDDLHWAMRSNTNYDAYLRMVADLLVRHFVDDIRIGGCFVDEEHAKILNDNNNSNNCCSGDASFFGDGTTTATITPAVTKWSCHSSRHFLRELIFSSALVPALDAVSDPDSFNRLLLNALGTGNSDDADPPVDALNCGAEFLITPTVAGPSANQQQEESFLSRFVEPYYTNTPDSLLGLKLNDLVENPYLTKLFEMYLRDLNGPTHLLDCFMQTRDIHMRIQMLGSVKLGKNSENDLQLQREVSEISFDAWQLFSTFVHSNGPNRISLDAQIEKDFAIVLETFKGRNLMGKNDENDGQPMQTQKQQMAALKPLEKVIELIYQQVHHNLQYNYVISFWQSENYLGYLCGAPPDVEELIGGGGSPTNDGNGALATRKGSTKMPEGSFSLFQFRKKLFNFITPSKEVTMPSSSASLDEFGTFPMGADIDDDGTAGGGGGTIAMADLGRDMAKWSVSIVGVAQRRATDQTFYHVYSISVERNDLPEECYTTSTGTTTTKGQLQSSVSMRASAEAEAEEAEDDFDAEQCTFGGVDEEEEELPKIWIVGHRCEEFFSLEDRLREHLAAGGSTNNSTLRSAGLNTSALPDRKSTLQLLHNGRNNRALLETYRVHFERFLQQLLQQPSMKRSDLLYIFLTSEENSTGLFDLATGGGGRPGASGSAINFLPDLNPIRAMRKVGGKERGQNLKPFILNLLANTLAPPTTRTSVPIPQMNITNRNGGDTMSVTSETTTSRSVDGGGGGGVLGSAASSLCSTNKLSKHCTTPTHTSQHPQFPPTDNEGGNQQQNVVGDIGTAGWTRNFYDLFMFLTLHLGLLARFPFWLESLLCSLRTFVNFLFSTFFRRKTAQILDDHLLNVEMAIYLVRALHELILFQNVPSSLSATPSQNSMTSATQLGKASAPTAVDQQKMRLQQKAGRQQATAPILPVSEQERKLRAELALHCVEKWVERTLPFSPFLRWAFRRFAGVLSTAFPSFCCPPPMRTSSNTTTIDRTSDDDGKVGVEDSGGGCGDNYDDSDYNYNDDGSGRQRVASVRLLFQCFQMPTLNRQLAFVLMDKVLQRVVVERPAPQQQQQQQPSSNTATA